MGINFFHRSKEKKAEEYKKPDEQYNAEQELARICQVAQAGLFIMPLLIGAAAIILTTGIVYLKSNPQRNHGNSGLETRADSAFVAPAQQDTAVRPDSTLDPRYYFF